MNVWYSNLACGQDMNREITSSEAPSRRGRRSYTVWAFIVASIAFALLSARAALASASVGGGLYVPGSILSFQANAGEKTVKHQFWIWNLSSADVDLTIQPSCGCLTPSWHSRRVGPYQPVALNVDVDASEVQIGVPKVISIATNLKSTPYFSLAFNRLP